MEKLRRNLAMSALAVVTLSLFTLSSCDDEEPVYAEPTIAVEVVSSTPGAIELLVAVTAPAGLKEVVVGDDVTSYTAGETSDIFTYTYAGSASALTFEVSDVRDRTAEETVEIDPIEIILANITANASWTADKKY